VKGPFLKYEGLLLHYTIMISIHLLIKYQEN